LNDRRPKAFFSCNHWNQKLVYHGLAINCSTKAISLITSNNLSWLKVLVGAREKLIFSRFAGSLFPETGLPEASDQALHGPQ
jgi:hypothetical protein